MVSAQFTSWQLEVVHTHLNVSFHIALIEHFHTKLVYVYSVINLFRGIYDLAQ